MKLSELFSTLLGDKDVELLSNESATTQSNSPTATTQPTHTSEPSVDTQTSTKQAVPPSSPAGANLTQEQFNALNAKIAELTEANRQLVTQGMIQQQPKMSDEQLIYELMKGAYTNGRPEHSNAVQYGTGVQSQSGINTFTAVSGNANLSVSQ